MPSYQDLSVKQKEALQSIWWDFLQLFGVTCVATDDDRIHRIRHRLIILWITNFPDEEWTAKVAAAFARMDPLDYSNYNCSLGWGIQRFRTLIGVRALDNEAFSDKYALSKDLQTRRDKLKGLIGPTWWRFIHAFTVYAPPTESAAVMESRRQFILHWLIVLPCATCVTHADHLPLAILDKNATCLQNKNHTLSWEFYSIHNTVNKQIGKEEFTRDAFCYVWNVPKHV